MDGMTGVGECSCTVCGVPFPAGAGGGHVCGDCARTPPPYTRAVAPLVFGGAVRTAVHALKYDGLRCMTGFLTGRFAGRLGGWFPDTSVVAPVPLHQNRLRERGFNQSLLIAMGAAKELDASLSIDGLVRTRDTMPQVALPPREREANVKGAFAVAGKDEFAGRGVLLVDDVFTTGATVRECARVLRKAGAEKVYVLTVARAVTD